MARHDTETGVADTKGMVGLIGPAIVAVTVCESELVDPNLLSNFASY